MASAEAFCKNLMLVKATPPIGTLVRVSMLTPGQSVSYAEGVVTGWYTPVVEPKIFPKELGGNDRLMLIRKQLQHSDRMLVMPCFRGNPHVTHLRIDMDGTVIVRSKNRCSVVSDTIVNRLSQLAKWESEHAARLLRVPDGLTAYLHDIVEVVIYPDANLCDSPWYPHY